jgi:hypothetical protein
MVKVYAADGIQCSSEDMINWTCKMNVYQVIWLPNKKSNATTFLQDLVYGVTYFIWIFVFISLLVSGMMLIFSAWDEKLAERGKTGVKYSVIWLILVVSSYAIIRFVQYFMSGK